MACIGDPLTDLKPNSPLLALPAELRNQIWSFLLVQEQQPNAMLPAHLFPGAILDEPSRIWVAILLSCRQAFREGTPILYGENTFLAHPSLLTGLPSLLLQRAPKSTSPPVKSARAISLIKRVYIHVRLDTDPRFTAAQVSAALSGLEELEVDVFQAMYGSCDFSVLKLFEGVRGVKKAVVEGSVGDGRYARWLERTMMADEGQEAGRYEKQVLGKSLGWDSWRDGNR